MKISVLIPYANPHVYPVFQELARLPETEVRIGVLQPAEAYRPNYRWSDLPGPNFVKLDDVRSRLHFCRSASRGDFVFTHGIWNTWEYVLSRLVLGRVRRLFVLSESENPLRKRGWKRVIKRGILKTLDRDGVTLLTLGNARENIAQYRFLGAKRWQALRFAYAPYPLGTGSTGPRNRVRDAQKIVALYVGQLIPRKNVSLALEAARHLRDGGVPFELRVVGDGPERENLMRFAEALGLGSQVRFLGHVAKGDELERLYASSDVFVLPSVFEGWGAVLNEAMYSGLPVLAAAGVCSTEELVVPGETGFTFADAPELSGLLRRLHEDRRLLTSLSEGSLARIRAWSPESLASKLHGLLLAWSAGRTAPPAGHGEPLEDVTR